MQASPRWQPRSSWALAADQRRTLLRGHRPAIAFAGGLQGVPAASEITRVEVLRGVRSGERRITDRLLGTFGWIPVDEPIAQRAGELGRRWRASHRGVATADLVIAATALEHGLDLANPQRAALPDVRWARAALPRLIGDP